MCNKHQQVSIKVNFKCISVDKDLANIIARLNDLGYKTSGCCIGVTTEDEAWICIQEANEDKIVELMNMLNECSYVLEKSLYKKNKDIAIIYVQYVLKTPKYSLYGDKLKYIHEWENALNSNISFVRDVQYRTMEVLFQFGENYRAISCLNGDSTTLKNIKNS